jgi:hypothetical protein
VTPALMDKFFQWSGSSNVFFVHEACQTNPSPGRPERFGAVVEGGGGRTKPARVFAPLAPLQQA